MFTTRKSLARVTVIIFTSKLVQKIALSIPIFEKSNTLESLTWIAYWKINGLQSNFQRRCNFLHWKNKNIYYIYKYI